VVVLLVSSFAWYLYGCPCGGIDDACIFFSYAQNLTSGKGITYAANGVQVEGCTSLLWMVLCSISFGVGAGVVGVFVISGILLTVAQFAFYKVFLRLDGGKHTGLALLGCGILILSSTGYVVWMAFSLMDVVLWGTVVSVLTAFLVQDGRPGRAWSLVFILAPWVRPEALLVVPVCLFVAGWRRRMQFRDLAVPALSFLVSQATLLVFRMGYFGYPLPNTYYAKVAPSVAYNIEQGLEYVLNFVLSGSVPLFFGGTTVVLIGCAMTRKLHLGWHGEDVRTALWIWALFLLLLPVPSGGDHFRSFRFIQPVYPLICILLVDLLFTLIARARGGKWRTFVLLYCMTTVVLAFSWSIDEGWIGLLGGTRRLDIEFSIAEKGRQDGVRLARLFAVAPRLPTLGVVTAGGIAITYPGQIVDLMGLNDVLIAHHPGDRRGMKNHAAFAPELFEKLGVEVMPFGPTGLYSRLLKGLCVSPPFVSCWRYGKLFRKDDPQNGVTVMIVTSLLKELLDSRRYGFSEVLVWAQNGWRCP